MTLLHEQGFSGSFSFVCVWQRLFDGRVCCCVGPLRADNAMPVSGKKKQQQQQQQQLTCCHAPGGL